MATKSVKSGDTTKDAEYVLKMASDLNVRFMRLWFTDVLGRLKSFAITIDELEGALTDGMGFDGSSIEGFARIWESDMMAHPDPSTFQMLPWRPADKGAVARMICDIKKPRRHAVRGRPSVRAQAQPAEGGQARLHVLRRAGARVLLLQDARRLPRLLDEGGYFDLTQLDAGSDLRRDTVLTLEEMGIPVEYSHHEVAPSQHEIDLRYADGLDHGGQRDDAPPRGQGNRAEARRVRDVHAEADLRRQRLRDARAPVAVQGRAQRLLRRRATSTSCRKTAKAYIAGLLKHAREFCAVTNQWVNSYKRLVPGYEAPVYLSWAKRNRSALVRVPDYKLGKEKATRAELQVPGPGVQPVPGVFGDAGRGPQGHRRELQAA